MIKTFSTSSPRRESIGSFQLTTPKAPRPIKRIHDIGSPALFWMGELQDNSPPRQTPITHHHEKIQKSYIPKTPDGEQLVHRRRSFKKECSKTTAQEVEFPFAIPLKDTDEPTVETKMETDGPQIGVDLSAAAAAAAEDDSFLLLTVVDSIEHQVRRREKNAPMSTIDKASEAPSSQIPWAVTVDSLLSDWSDVSESDAEGEEGDLSLAFKKVGIVPKQLHSSNQKARNRFVRNIHSSRLAHFETNPAA